MKKTLVLAGCVTMLLGCDKLSPPPTLQDARYAIEQNDSDKAIIQLKNIIQAQPSSPEARLLLAQIYFDIGHYAGAEKEYQWVLEAQPENLASIKGLYESLFFQDKYESILTLSHHQKRLPDELQTQIFVYRAVSNFKIGNKFKSTGKAGIFAGSLELVKEGNLKIKQENLFQDIYIKENK